MVNLFLCIGTGICVSALVTWLMIKVNIVDVPEHRSSHTRPTPKCGGVGVMAGLITTLSLIISNDLMITHGFPPWSPYLLTVLLTTLALCTLGFLDDLFGLSFKWRLLVQLSAAFFICYFNTPLASLPLPGFGTIELGWTGWLLSLFWIVGFTNAFNFMDGINGISASTTLISCLFLNLFFLYPFTLNDVVCWSLIAGTLGFLPFNIPRARIFLGDVGSQGMGFLLGILALAIINESHGVSIFTMLLLFMPFCFDAGFTLIRRALARENIFQAHRSHLYQLLNQLGLSHTQVTLLYVAMSCASGLLACISTKLVPEHHIYLLATTLLSYSLFAYVVVKQAKRQKLLS